MSRPQGALLASVVLIAAGGAVAAAYPETDPGREASPVLKPPAGPPVPLRSSPARRPEPVVLPPELERIAACESGGDPTAIGGGGAYRGKYQFTRETWRALGGEGDPAAAPEAEQDRRALVLYERSGAASWPACVG
jgi:Transglycosylase-like domain